MEIRLEWGISMKHGIDHAFQLHTGLWNVLCHNVLRTWKSGDCSNSLQIRISLLNLLCYNVVHVGKSQDWSHSFQILTILLNLMCHCEKIMGLIAMLTLIYQFIWVYWVIMFGFCGKIMRLSLIYYHIIYYYIMNILVKCVWKSWDWFHYLQLLISLLNLLCHNVVCVWKSSDRSHLFHVLSGLLNLLCHNIVHLGKSWDLYYSMLFLKIGLLNSVCHNVGACGKIMGLSK